MLTYPAVLSMLSLNVMQFSDRIFLARFNMQHFAASFPAGIISFTFLSFFLGISAYVKDLASQFYGAQKKGQCTISAWQGIYFSIIMGIILILSYPITSNIFVLAGHAPELIPLEKNYFFWMFVSGSISILVNALTGFFYGISNTKVPMIANVIANLSNIFFNWVLIFGKFGFSPLGITGAGIGTTLGQIVSLVILVCVFFNKKTREEFRTHKLYKFNFIIVKKLIRFGIPSGIAYFLDIGQWGLFIMIVGKIGEKALASANISIGLESISFLLIVGLATGTSIITGQERGAGRLDNIHKVLFKSLVVAFFYDLLILFFFIGFPDILISMFNSKANTLYFYDIKNTVVILLRITGFWLFLDAVRIILISVLRSLGDSRFLMLSTFFGGSMLVASAYIAVVVFNAKLMILWLLIICYVFSMSTLLFLRFLSGKWKSINVI